MNLAIHLSAHHLFWNSFHINNPSIMSSSKLRNCLTIKKYDWIKINLKNTAELKVYCSIT